MPPRMLHRFVTEPWLSLSRRLTLGTLERMLRHRAAVPTYTPQQGAMLYVAASALPYHISGYTTRTHEVVCALQVCFPHIQVMTRPGYPWDRGDRLCTATSEETVVEGVRYGHARKPTNNRPVLQYAVQASRAIMVQARKHQVAVIHAASNHVNALPALLAARRLGIGFQYEMRGLWELTRISRHPEFEHSQAFQQGLQLERLVACHADRLFVISTQLGRYVAEHWGIAESAIHLLPNCIDPQRIEPVPAQVQPDVIGYAGSLIGYEGLDTLLDAVQVLRAQGISVRVRIVGDGEARGALQAQADRLGLQEAVAFLGKLPPEQARRQLAECALVCIPRKPFQVCAIVPPIKLVEALAMGKAVVVPDLPVFRDELAGSGAAWFFRAGDVLDLAKVLACALQDAGKLEEMGKLARIHAVTQRNWLEHVRKVLPGGAA